MNHHPNELTQAAIREAELTAEIGRLKAERDHWEREAHDHAYDSVDEIERLHEALLGCREFIAGMYNTSKPGAIGISSYHPCGALLDKIDTAMSVHQQSPHEPVMQELADQAQDLGMGYGQCAGHSDPAGCCKGLTPEGCSDIPRGECDRD